MYRCIYINILSLFQVKQKYLLPQYQYKAEGSFRLAQTHEAKQALAAEMAARVPKVSFSLSLSLSLSLRVCGYVSHICHGNITYNVVYMCILR